MAVDKLVDSNQLDADLTSVANAIRAKGGTSDPLAFPVGFVSAVNSIPTGGGAPVEGKDVNFIDYDGTIVASYTADEFAALAALPENPTHDGLTAQGWNWTLADAKAYVENHGKLFIGQMYITDDGKTRIYIHLERGRLAPYLGFTINGSAVVDWGDGSEPESITESSAGVVTAQHEYPDSGDYVIAIAVTGNMTLIGDSSGTRLLSMKSTGADNSMIYRSAIRKIEIGSNVSIGAYAFSCCGIVSITIPKTIIPLPNNQTSWGYYAFIGCYSLVSLTIPDTNTSIASSSLQRCYALALISIPNSVTRILDYAIQDCVNLRSLTIPDSVTSIGNYYVFSGCKFLSSLTISNSLTTITNGALNGDTSLVSLTIPNSVTSIMSTAFNNCYGLAEVHFLSDTPPAVSASNAFANLPTDCKIYVPTGSLSAYTSATNYPDPSTYTYIEE